MDTIYPLLQAADVATTAAFYRDVIGLAVTVDLGWFCLLADPQRPHAQVGIIDTHHESIPTVARGATPTGMLVTVDSDDCDLIHARALDAAAPVVVEPVTEPWGQRHTMLRDPAGTLVDIVTDVSPDAS